MKPARPRKPNSRTADASANRAANSDALPQALEALRTYDRGSGRAALKPIDDTVAGALVTSAAQRALEKALLEFLRTEVSDVAKTYICSKLKWIGSRACVPALAALVSKDALSQSALDALETIPDPEAARALRRRLSDLTGVSRIGVINSLGARRDPESVSTLAGLLAGTDDSTAGAAAEALGNIGTTEAARALKDFRAKAPESIRLTLAHACLMCAERLLACGDNEPAALALCQAIAESGHPSYVRTAAARGAMLARSGMQGAK
jgi:HEAT repeat protein